MAPCAQHAESLSVAPCARCERPYCGDCLVEILDRLYCGPCKVEQVRDLQSGADAMCLDLAPIDRRLVALFIDNLILAMPFWMFAAWLSQSIAALRTTSSVFPQVLAWLSYAWLAISYEGALLSRRGQTLGKRVAKVRVVSADGAALRPGRAWLRALARVVLSALVVVDYVPALFSRERVCLHDLLARSRVVRWTD